MDLTYKIRAADGKEYGPVTLSQLTSWLRESRVTPQSEVMRSDMNYWVPAANYSELQDAAATPPVAIPHAATPASAGATTHDPATVAQMKSGAGWFYWVAGLSLVNSAAAFMGSDWHFFLGLGITGIIDALGSGVQTEGIQRTGQIVALVLNLLAAGVLIVLGMLASRRHTWAFMLGMVLIGLDTLIFLLGPDWIGLAFHLLILYCLFRGLKACRELNRA